MSAETTVDLPSFDAKAGDGLPEQLRVNSMLV